jgi:hypothetical protein
MPQDSDPIEDDWRVVRPVRNPSDSSTLFGEASIVWVGFRWRAEPTLARIPVEVPRKLESVRHEIAGTWEVSDLPIFYVHFQKLDRIESWTQEEITHIILVSGMDLYLGSTGPTRIATTHSGTMPPLELSFKNNEPIDLTLAFVIDAPGVITVLHKESNSPLKAPSNWLLGPWPEPSDTIPINAEPPSSLWNYMWRDNY